MLIFKLYCFSPVLLLFLVVLEDVIHFLEDQIKADF